MAEAVTPAPNPTDPPLVVRLGTRGSALATTQSNMVADQLRELGLQVELVIIRTEGDDVRIRLDAPSRPGAFVAALRDELLGGTVDLAVHSFKDLPSDPVPGLTIAAIPPREHPADALITRAGTHLDELPLGATVGTSSPRRAAAMLRARPDLKIVPIRGNVDTRIAAVTTGKVDATVLAWAGLRRLGRDQVPAQLIDPQIMVPAPAQGALAVECRADSPLLPYLAQLDDSATRIAVAAERAVLGAIAATCTTAVGALAQIADDQLTLTVEISDHAGVEFRQVHGTCPWPATENAAAQLGRKVALAALGVNTEISDPNDLTPSELETSIVAAASTGSMGVVLQ